jgi:hypothetical protein
VSSDRDLRLPCSTLAQRLDPQPDQYLASPEVAHAMPMRPSIGRRSRTATVLGEGFRCAEMTVSLSPERSEDLSIFCAAIGYWSTSA